MDSRGTYHMCVKKLLKLKEGAIFLLRNNKVCKGQGAWFIKLKMFDNQDMLL